MGYKFPDEKDPKDFLPSLIKQNYYVTGVKNDVKRAISDIEEELSEYKCEIEGFKRLSEEKFQEFAKIRKEIQYKLMVFIGLN